MDVCCRTQLTPNSVRPFRSMWNSIQIHGLSSVRRVMSVTVELMVLNSVTVLSLGIRLSSGVCCVVGSAKRERVREREREREKDTRA